MRLSILDFVIILVGAAILALTALFAPQSLSVGIAAIMVLLGVALFYRLEQKKNILRFEQFLQALVANQATEVPAELSKKPWQESLRLLKMIQAYLNISRQGLEDRQALYEEMESQLLENEQILTDTEVRLKKNEQLLQHSEYKVLESTLALQHINIIQHKIQGGLNIDGLLSEAMTLLLTHLSVHRGFFLKIDLLHQSGTVVHPLNTPYEEGAPVAVEPLLEVLKAEGLDKSPEEEVEQIPVLVLNADKSPFLEIAFQAAVLIPVWIDRELWGAFCLFDKEMRLKQSEGEQSFQAFGESDKLVLQNVVAFLQRDLKNAYLFEMATIDSLSQLYVRRYFENRLQDEIRRVSRHPSVFSLMMLDIDYFKRVNDTYGHLVGDEVIRQVASLLKGQLRQGLDLSARYGGEEMVVLLPHTTLEEAQMVAERIREQIESMELEALAPKENPQVTISIGLSSYPQHGASQRELLEAADQALYRAKEGGRNRVCLAQIASQIDHV